MLLPSLLSPWESVLQGDLVRILWNLFLGGKVLTSVLTGFLTPAMRFLEKFWLLGVQFLGSIVFQSLRAKMLSRSVFLNYLHSCHDSVTWTFLTSNRITSWGKGKGRGRHDSTNRSQSQKSEGQGHSLKASLAVEQKSSRKWTTGVTVNIYSRIIFLIPLVFTTPPTS